MPLSQQLVPTESNHWADSFNEKMFLLKAANFLCQSLRDHWWFFYGCRNYSYQIIEKQCLEPSVDLVLGLYFRELFQGWKILTYWKGNARPSCQALIRSAFCHYYGINLAPFLVVAKARRTDEDKEIEEEEAEVDLDMTWHFSWCATLAAGSTAVTRAHN